jgi:3-methylcrotonyl-CoA carboxylase beta subunit
VNAVSTAGVPKITCIIGASYGAGNYGMCGRAFNPRFLFAWPNSKIAVMGGDQAANVLVQVKLSQLEKEGKKPSEDKVHELRSSITDSFESESSCYFSTARMWDDGIILPQ